MSMLFGTLDPRGSPRQVLKKKSMNTRGSLHCIAQDRVTVCTSSIWHMIRSSSVGKQGKQNWRQNTEGYSMPSFCMLEALSFCTLSDHKDTELLLVSKFSGKKGLLKAQRPDGPNSPNVESRATSPPRVLETGPTALGSCHAVTTTISAGVR